LATTETPYFNGDTDFTDGLPTHAAAGWSISGLWIDFSGVGLHVYNGTDANGPFGRPRPTGLREGDPDDDLAVLDTVHGPLEQLLSLRATTEVRRLPWHYQTNREDSRDVTGCTDLGTTGRRFSRPS
jgi:hypothetical protein